MPVSLTLAVKFAAIRIEKEANGAPKLDSSLA